VNRKHRRARAQTDILSTAAGLIAANGYHGTSMRDLAEATGRGLSSLYTYFPSKEALLLAMQTRAFDSLMASAEGAVLAGQPAEQRLYGFMLNHIRYFLEHPDVMRVLVQEARVLPPRYRRRVRAQKERYYAMAENLIKELSARGRRRSMAAAELERTTYGMFGLVNWVWAWYEPGRHGHHRDVARTLHTMIVRGITGKDVDPEVWEHVEAGLGHRVGSPLADAASRSRQG
jgi:AcrR family transcriptional regulator